MSFALFFLGTLTTLTLFILVAINHLGFWEPFAEAVLSVIRRGPVLAVFAVIAMVLFVACSSAKNDQVKLACDAAKSLAVAATSFCKTNASVPVCKDVPKAVSTIDVFCAFSISQEG